MKAIVKILMCLFCYSIIHLDLTCCVVFHSRFDFKNRNEWMYCR